MFFRSNSLSSQDYEYVREANIQIELMHSELQLSSQQQKTLQEENTKLRYQLARANRENKQLREDMTYVLERMQPVEELYLRVRQIKERIKLPSTSAVEEAGLRENTQAMERQRRAEQLLAEDRSLRTDHILDEETKAGWTPVSDGEATSVFSSSHMPEKGQQDTATIMAVGCKEEELAIS